MIHIDRVLVDLFIRDRSMLSSCNISSLFNCIEKSGLFIFNGNKLSILSEIKLSILCENILSICDVNGLFILGESELSVCFESELSNIYLGEILCYRSVVIRGIKQQPSFIDMSTHRLSRTLPPNTKPSPPPPPK